MPSGLRETTAADDGAPAADDARHEALVAPPQQEVQALYRLAQMGNMRDIADYAERIGSLDPCYRPFAEHLKRLANGYQSKAILTFVERYLNDSAS